jgi:hypothetical protein
MEKVHFQLESTLPELRDLEEKGLFTKQELRQITLKRTKYESALVKRAGKPEDYLDYAKYEIGLEKLRRLRWKRLREWSCEVVGCRVPSLLFCAVSPCLCFSVPSLLHSLARTISNAFLSSSLPSFLPSFFLSFFSTFSHRFLFLLLPLVSLLFLLSLSRLISFLPICSLASALPPSSLRNNLFLYLGMDKSQQPRSISSHSIPRRILYILRRSTEKFPTDTRSWLAYVDYAKSEGMNKIVVSGLTA